MVIFPLLDPNPDSESRSTDLIESGSNPDPDPKHCKVLPTISYLALCAGWPGSEMRGGRESRRCMLGYTDYFLPGYLCRAAQAQRCGVEA